MKLLIKLYLAFLKIGTFRFGGGYAMLPFIQKEIVEKNNWISSTEFTDIIGISQMTPGPVAINSATFVGYKINGVIGSIVATLGVITTSFILVIIINRVLDKFKESKIVILFSFLFLSIILSPTKRSADVRRNITPIKVVL